MAAQITSSGAVGVGFCDGLLITNNIALTGTITITTTASTVDGGSATAIAIITNPVVGEQHIYRGLRGQGTVNINPSATCNITWSKLGPGPAI